MGLAYPRQGCGFSRLNLRAGVLGQPPLLCLSSVSHVVPQTLKLTWGERHCQRSLQSFPSSSACYDSTSIPYFLASSCMPLGNHLSDFSHALYLIHQEGGSMDGVLHVTTLFYRKRGLFTLVGAWNVWGVRQQMQSQVPKPELLCKRTSKLPSLLHACFIILEDLDLSRGRHICAHKLTYAHKSTCTHTYRNSSISPLPKIQSLSHLPCMFVVYEAASEIMVYFAWNCLPVWI
jgi:hypothetical protein